MDSVFDNQDSYRTQPGNYSRRVAQSPVSPRCGGQAPAPVLVGAFFTGGTRNAGRRTVALWLVAAAGAHVLRRILRRLAALSVQRHAACGIARRRARFSPVHAHCSAKSTGALSLLAYELPHRAPYVCGRTVLQSGQAARSDTRRLTQAATRAHCGVARYHCHRKKAAGRSCVSVCTGVARASYLVKRGRLTPMY